jgi:hypothetical protein
MNGFSAFVTLQKVDVAKREVWGVAAVEQPDRAGEIMDYALSKANFVKWSKDMEKATQGKSKGNLRGMHNDIAAGKVIHFEPNDEKKLFYIGTKVVDDNEWRKVLEGVYTGFSVGGSYGKKWADPANIGLTRYEAKPVEISLVDVPCMPGAQFEVVKADGATEMRKFVTIAGADLAKGDKDGHPFRGNQWTNGTGEHNGIKYAATGKKGTNRMTGQSVEEFEDIEERSPSVWVDEEGVVYNEAGEVENVNDGIPDRVTEAAGTEADFNAREDEKKRRLQDDRVKRLKAENERRAAAREKFVNSDITPATGSAQEAAMGMTEQEFNALDEMGYVKPWGVSEEGMSELETMRQDRGKNLNIGAGTEDKRQQSRSQQDAMFDALTRDNSKMTPDFEGGSGASYERWKRRKKIEADNPGKSVEQAISDKIKARKQKAAGPGDLIKLLAEANMEPNELIQKLQGSSDPAMISVATQLSKAFPPPKKKAPGKEEEPAPEGDGGDQPEAKGKGNPFAKEKDGAEEEAVPGEENAPGEEDDSEMESGETTEEQIDPKTGEPVEQAGQMSPEQAESVKMVVISLLEELGLVQRQESAPGTGGMQLSVSIAGLSKAMGVQGLTKRFELVLGDVGKLAATVDDLEKRLGVMPVLRELSGSANPLLEQQADLLKGMLNGATDPNIRQAIQNELATLEIKKIQKGT